MFLPVSNISAVLVDILQGLQIYLQWSSRHFKFMQRWSRYCLVLAPDELRHDLDMDCSLTKYVGNSYPKVLNDSLIKAHPHYSMFVYSVMLFVVWYFTFEISKFCPNMSCIHVLWPGHELQLDKINSVNQKDVRNFSSYIKLRLQQFYNYSCNIILPLILKHFSIMWAAAMYFDLDMDCSLAKLYCCV